jgi:putative membrane protein
MRINPIASMFNADFMKRVLIGIVIGIASITPGLSAGVIAAAAGLYEPAVRAVVNARKEFKNSVMYLMPLAIGAGLGIFLFSNVMQLLMITAEFLVLYIFLGLVAGGVPALIEEANSGGFQKRYLWASAAVFVFIISFNLIMAQFPNGIRIMELDFVGSLICGAVLAFGTIIPGISSSFILMYLGIYEKLLAVIAGFDIKILAMIAVGFGAAALIMIKLVDVLFRKFRGFMYYSIIAFLMASIDFLNIV